MNRALQTFGYAILALAVCASITMSQDVGGSNVSGVMGNDLPGQPDSVAGQPSPSRSQLGSKPKRRFPGFIYIQKSDGSLIPVAEDIAWSRFDELANATSDDADDGVAVTSLSMVAKASADIVSLENRIELQVQKAGSFRIPIRMSECNFLRQPTIATENSNATVVARFVQERDEYELLLACEEPGALVVEFPTEVVLRKIGNRSLLALSIPRYPVSRFDLQVPETDIEGKAATGMTANATEEESGTRFRIDGLIPQFEIWWQPQQALVESNSFAVTGEVDAQVDDLGEVTRSVTLQANSFGQPLDGFTLKLPKDTQWNRTATSTDSGFSINAVGNDDGSESLQIVFDESAVQPVPVRIRLNSTPAKSADKSTLFDLASFEVEGATSQSGTVRVVSEGSWLLRYELGRFARRIENVDSEAKATEYSRPGQVQLRVSQRTAELIVEPLYFVALEEATARLTAKFRCTRRGPRATNLDIEMKDWIFQSIGPDPDNVVMQIEKLLAPNNGILRLPLDPTLEKFEVTVVASRSIDGGLPRAWVPTVDAELSGFDDFPEEANDDEFDQPELVNYAALDFQFPAVRETTTLLPSQVALVSDSNVVASPGQTDNYTEISMPERVQKDVQTDSSVVCLQALNMGPPAVLPVNAALLQRSTQIDIETQIIDIDADRIRIRQQMRWHVMDVPLSRAVLSMHKSVHDFGSIEVEINGTTVVPSRSPMYPSTLTDYETVQVPIPPGLGAFDMTVTYDWTRWDDDGTVLGLEGFDEFDVDLVLPRSSNRGRADRISIRNEVRKPRIANYDVSLTVNRNRDLDWAWSLETPDPDIEAFSTQMDLNILPITTREVTASSPTTKFKELVDRAWFQTWYTQNARSARAVFRVQGGDEVLQIEIPQTWMDNLIVWVDGVKTESRPAGDNLIEVSVDADQPAHVVELHTTVEGRDAVGRLTTGLPRIAGADVMGQWYWHVIMPRNECMVTWPRKLTRAHSWDWSSVFPRRKSEMTLAELENWSGALPSSGRIHSGSSEYLFGAMGEPDDALTIRTALLPVYLLSVAGSMLVVGLLLVYSKKRMLVFVLIGIAICCLIFIHPSYASMAGQMASLGIVLAVLAQVLLWVFQHSPVLSWSKDDSAPDSWIRRIDRSSRGETTTMEGGSSRYRNVQ